MIQASFTLPRWGWELHCEFGFYPGCDPLDTDEQIEVRRITDATGHCNVLAHSLWLALSELTEDELRTVREACQAAEMQGEAA
jgi:heat shock protein HslJ